MKAKIIIIGAAVAVGIIFLVVGLQRRAASYTDGDETASSGSNKSKSGFGLPSWLGGSESSTSAGRNPSWSESEEAARQAKQRELELAAARQLKRTYDGAAGGPPILPRYSSDAKGIGMAMVGVTPALRNCYEGVGSVEGKLPDDVHVRMTIAPDPRDPNRGIVTRAETQESAFHHPAVEGCVQNAVSMLTFDRVAKPVEANLPLVLSRRN